MKKLFLATIIALGSFAGFSQVKIVHLDVQKVIDTLPSYKAAKKELQLFMEDAQNQLAAIEKQLDDVLIELEKLDLEGGSELQKERLRKRAQKIQQNYYETEQIIQRDYQVTSNRLNKPILDLIEKAISNVSERLKITYVLDIAALHYYAKGEDITNLVIAEALALEKANAPK